MRVIFDRSAFHGDNFGALQASPLLTLTRRGTVKVFLTPVFLNETLTAYGSKRPVQWQQHLSYALDACNGGIFLDKMDIWHEELVMGRGRLARHLMPEKPKRDYDSRPRFVAKLREVAATGDLNREWVDSQAERDEAYQKSVKQKAISAEVRQEAVDRLGGTPTPEDLAKYPFSAFRATELIRSGAHLMSLVDARRTSALMDQWARAPDDFPFFTAFVEGLLYNGYYATLSVWIAMRRRTMSSSRICYGRTWSSPTTRNSSRGHSIRCGDPGGNAWKARRALPISLSAWRSPVPASVQDYDGWHIYFLTLPIDNVLVS